MCWGLVKETYGLVNGNIFELSSNSVIKLTRVLLPCKFIHMYCLFISFSGFKGWKWHRYFSHRWKKINYNDFPFNHLKYTFCCSFTENILSFESNLFHYGQYTLINTNMTFICVEGTFKNNTWICINIQNHQKINNIFLWHSLAVNIFSFLSKQNSLSQNNNHLHFWTILFNKRVSITEFAWALTINCIVIQIWTQLNGYFL